MDVISCSLEPPSDSACYPLVSLSPESLALNSNARATYACMYPCILDSRGYATMVYFLRRQRINLRWKSAVLKELYLRAFTRIINDGFLDKGIGATEFVYTLHVSH